MSVEVIPTKNFQREAKPLLKKYKSLKGELASFTEEVKENPEMGTLIKENTYKHRLAVESKGKGKSGGLRIITYHVEFVSEDLCRIFLVSVYDKSDLENIPDHILDDLVQDIQDELEEE